MGLPVAVTAAAAMVASEATGLAASKLAGKQFPATIHIENRTDYDLETVNQNAHGERLRGGAYMPSGSIDGQILGRGLGSGESRIGQHPANRMWPVTSLEGTRSFSIFSTYGTGLDSLAGNVIYVRTAGNGRASNPITGILFAWFAGGGVGPLAAAIPFQGRPPNPQSVWNTRLKTVGSLSTDWVDSASQMTRDVSGHGFTTRVEVGNDPSNIFVSFIVRQDGFDEVEALAASPRAATTSAATGTDGSSSGDETPSWGGPLTDTEVTGRNAAKVVVGPDTGTPNGQFRQVGDSEWVETDPKGDQVRFRFTETGRDDWSVYLLDSARDVRLQIDLHRRLVRYRAGTADWIDLYPITRSFAIDV